MTTALALDPTMELHEALGEHDIQPVITVGNTTALVSYRHPHQIITDIWVRRESAWQLMASHAGA